MIWRVTLLGFLAFGLVIAALQITQNIPEFQTLNAGINALVNPLSAPTMIIRLDLWRETVFPLIRDSLLFGYGTGSAGEGLSNLFTNTNSIYITSHNVFFKIQFELGLLGLALFLIFLMFSVLHIWRANRRLQDPFLIVIRDWSLATTAAIFVSGFTGAILDAYPVNLIFWLIIGISSRLYMFEPQEDSSIVSTQNTIPSTQTIN
jgi:O-antigen ligase